jgi:hypothetical protein
MAKQKRMPTGDYPVGYARTPVRTRFQKGQSGCPGGRKLGSRNFKTIFREAMARMVELTERGKRRSVDAPTALLLDELQDALKGNHKARTDLLDRCERYLNDPDDGEEELPEEDQAMLDAALQRRRRREEDEGDGHG